MRVRSSLEPCVVQTMHVVSRTFSIVHIMFRTQYHRLNSEAKLNKWRVMNVDGGR